MSTNKDNSRFHHYFDTDSFSLGMDISILKWNTYWKYSLGINLGFWYCWIYFGRIKK